MQIVVPKSEIDKAALLCLEVIEGGENLSQQQFTINACGMEGSQRFCSDGCTLIGSEMYSAEGVFYNDLVLSD